MTEMQKDPLITIFNGRVRVLGEGGQSRVYLQVDVLMRDHLGSFSSSEWKVFTAIALHSNADGWAWPSVAHLAAETGLHQSTVKRALRGLEGLYVQGQRVLLRYQPRKSEIDIKTQGGAGRFHSNHYLIFPSVDEVARFCKAGIQHLGAGTGGGFKKGEPSLHKPTTVKPTTVKPTTENATTNHNHVKQEPSGVGVGNSGDSLELLLGIGITLGEARKLAGCDVEQVRGWVEYARTAKGLTNPAALVVARLKEGLPAPVTVKAQNDRSRYGCYCGQAWEPGYVQPCPVCGECEDCCGCREK